VISNQAGVPFGPGCGCFAISRKLFSNWMPAALVFASHNLLKVKNTMNLGSTHGEIHISFTMFKGELNRVWVV
jgi:hypothetical protein